MMSKWGIFRHGFPSGSSLAPLLFVVFINDVPERVVYIPSTTTSLFAADMAALTTGSSVEQACVSGLNWWPTASLTGRRIGSA